MRVRRRQHLKVKNLLITCVVMAPILLGGAYAAVAYGILGDLSSWVYDLEANPDEFYLLDEINITQLAQLANRYEERLEQYHLPLNLTVGAEFWASTRELYQYDSTDNGALWTGYATCAEACRYASLPTGLEKNDSRRVLYRLVNGLANLLRIPNGGLGPEYPGILARYYAPPEKVTDGNFTWMFNEFAEPPLSPNYKHFNGSGPYSQWRVRLYTSKDELGGYLLGLAALQRFCTDDAWINETARLCIGQLTVNFLKNNWQLMHGDGTPDGVVLNPVLGTGGEWKLLMMRLAANAYPNNTDFERIYTEYASKEMYALNTPQLAPHNNVEPFYAYGFGHCVILGLLLAEHDPTLLTRYTRNYEKSYQIFQGHRNAFFNAIYLAACQMATDAEPRFTPTYNVTKVRWDVLDELWRFNVTNWFPMDNTYGGDDYTVSRAELNATYPQRGWLAKDPKIEKWQQFFQESIWGPLFSWVPGVLLTDRYMKPATAEMFKPVDFIWGDDPFSEYGGHNRSGAYISESSGTSFTLPYWILRAFNYL